MKKIYFISLLFVLVGCQSAPTKYDIGKCDLLPNVNKISDSSAANKKLWEPLNEKFEKQKRKLIVFLDGTRNDGKDRTNIREMYRLSVKQACDNNPVIPYYDKGVGGHWFDGVRGGFSGSGISRNIKQAYSFLVKTYQANDEIFIFGFSRGAYTARSLNGMIELAGLLDKESVKKNKEGGFDQRDLKNKVNDIYKSYHVKSKYSKNDRPKYSNDIRLLVEDNIKNNNLTDELLKVTVKGIGVFETVAALGFTQVAEPKKHHTDLYAKTGFHALAIDEIRDKFRLLRFNKDIDRKKQKLEEVWFAGVHSNVGGGYDITPSCNTSQPNDAYYYDGLETTPLNWMTTKFKDEGIFRFDNPFTECRSGKIHDEYYDSWFPPYRLMGKFIRQINDDDIIHCSVIERIKNKLLPRYHLKRESNGRYMPTNLNRQILENLSIQ